MINASDEHEATKDQPLSPAASPDATEVLGEVKSAPLNEPGLVQPSQSDWYPKYSLHRPRLTLLSDDGKLFSVDGLMMRERR